MLIEYLQKALEMAHYEIIEDEKAYWGEMPGFQGVWGKAETLEKCRSELKESLEEWLIYRLRNGLPLPVVDGIDLNIIEQAA